MNFLSQFLEPQNDAAGRKFFAAKAVKQELRQPPKCPRIGAGGGSSRVAAWVDRAAVTLGGDKSVSHERFRRLTLRSATAKVAARPWPP